MKPLFAHGLILALSTFLVVCCSALLEWDAQGNLIAHSYSVWGDWSAHLTFIEGFRQRGLFWISGDNPIFTGAPFQYPFLSHLLTAAFASIFSLTSIRAVEVLSLFLMALAPLLTYRVFKKLGASPTATALSVILFFLAGGYQWWSGLGPELKATEPWTNQFDQASVFTQFVAFEFYPQRAFLFGLTMLCGFGALILEGKRKWLSLLALGLLAITHIHSFLALAVFLMILFLQRRDRRTFFFSAGVAVIGGIGLSFLLLRSSPAEYQFVWERWMPGWALNAKSGIAAAADMNPIQFWIWNTGLWIPSVFLCMGLVWRQKLLARHPLVVPCFFSGLILFVLANLWNIQPYWYDNLKLFTYAFFFWAPLFGLLWDYAFKKNLLLKTLGVAFIISQTLSGVHDLWFLKSGNQSATFFSPSEFAVTEVFQGKRSSADALTIFNPRHNHWVSCLAGQRVWMGFPGWLWSWGIQYGAREQQLHQILLGAPNAHELLQKNKIEYIVLHASDRIGPQPVNLEFFRRFYVRIIEKDGWEVFATKSP
jgi:hypothetical protein